MNDSTGYLKKCLAVAMLIVPITSSAVVGGADTPVGRYPFAASIQFKQEGSTPLQRHGCGASLIASDWVLTAAHCLLDTEPSDIEVIVGRTRLSNAQQGQVLSVQRIVIHPDFPRTLAPDVALLKLDRAAIGITPIKVTTPDDTFEGRLKHLNVIGWGNAARNPPDVRPDILQRGRLPRITDTQCSTLVPNLNLRNSFCIGADGLIPDSGDSGGPVFIKRRNKGYVQLGVVSQGIVIARLSNPVVADFIRKTLDIPGQPGAMPFGKD